MTLDRILTAVDRSADRPEPIKTDQPLSGPVADEQPTVINQTHVTCCRPWCAACGGWRGIEREWADGQVDTVCRSCNRPIPDWPDLHNEPEEGSDDGSASRDRQT